MNTNIIKIVPNKSGKSFYLELATNTSIKEQISSLNYFIDKNQKQLRTIQEEIDHYYEIADENIDEKIEDSLWEKQSYIEVCIRLAKAKLSQLGVQFMPQKIGNRLLKTVNDYCAVDLETTGFDWKYDEIIEICIMRVRNSIITDKFVELVKPTIHIPYDIEELTSISDKTVENAFSISEILPKALDFIGEDVVLGHNSPFDCRFISYASQNFFKKPFLNQYINTLPLAKRAFPYLKNHSLQTLAYELNLPFPTHRAEADCLATKTLYDRILETAKEKGINLYEIKKDLKPSDIVSKTTHFDENHSFYKKICVITGALSIPRKDAWQKIKDVGGIPKDNLTLDTNYLIVSNDAYLNMQQGIESEKLKKAKARKAKGDDINIISEETFFDLLNGD